MSSIIRVEDIETTRKAEDACLKDGLKTVEITFMCNSTHKIIDEISNSRKECLLGVGGDLTAGASTGDFKSITEKSRAYIEKVVRARSNYGQKNG